MANFWRLDPPNERKEISRQERIKADKEKWERDHFYYVEGSSVSVKQKIKFFLEAISVPKRNGEAGYNTYVVGKYYECESGDFFRVLAGGRWYTFAFGCEDRHDYEGESFTEYEYYFMPTLFPGSRDDFILYASDIVFQDSFKNHEKGWLNANDSDNIIEEIEENDQVIGEVGAMYQTAFYGDNLYNPLPAAGLPDVVTVWEDDRFVITAYRDPDTGLEDMYFALMPVGQYEILPGNNSHIGNGQKGNSVGKKWSVRQPYEQTIVNRLSPEAQDFKIHLFADEFDHFIIDIEFMWEDTSEYVNKIRLKLNSYINPDTLNWTFAWQGTFVERTPVSNILNGVLPGV